MNTQMKRLLISVFLGVGMLWMLLGVFSITPIQAQTINCEDPSFMQKLWSQCPTTAAETQFEQPAASWLHALFAAEAPSPEQSLEEAYQRVLDVGDYAFSAESEQTLIPRARIDMIGQTQQRVDMHVDGEVTLPDYSQLNISLDGPGLDATPVAIVQEGTNSYLLRDGIKTPVENPAGLTSPTGDYLNYLVAAENVQLCESVAVPFPHAEACYIYDIDGPKYAEHVRLQMQAEMANKPGAAALGINVEASPIIEQMSGQGKIWLDKYGLPLRQKIDMFVPEADEFYDADVRMVIDYRFEETAVAALPTSQSIFAIFQIPAPTSAEVVSAVKTTLPHVFVFAFFLVITATLILFARRRWMYKIIAITMILTMVTTPMLQVINVHLFYTHQAHAAEASETFADTFVIDSEDTPESSTTAATAPSTPSLDPMHQPLSAANSYEPSSYCGAGGNGDRDGDGLADDAENCLGTNPNLADSDGDGIDDGTEVNGFQYGLTVTQTWHSNPTRIDTNMDGIYDSMEWPKEFNGQAENWDLDKDGLPNLYDTDDDGDGVADKRDISPASYTEYFSKTVSVPSPPLIQLPLFTFPLFNFNPEPITKTETVTTPIGLNISGQYNGYAYVDLQVQPQDLDHLRYGTTPLDWGYDDKGQIQEHNGAVDEDIRLTPMLIVESNVAPSEELAEGYHVSTYKDADGDGYSELMLPLYRVGDAGNVETFHARMAYGPEALGSLGNDSIHWRNIKIIWMVKGTFDKESADGTRTQQEMSLHTYEEPATRITGWEVTKSGPFESAIFGTPEFQDDDRALFQLAFGLNQTYLQNPDTDLDEINARFSGANTPAAEKWGITTTLAIDLPLEAYGHADAGVADLNNRIKSFVSDHYSFDSPNTVIVAYQSQTGEANLDDIAGTGTKFSAGINLNNVSLRTQRSLQVNMRDGWKPISNGDMALEVMKRVQPDAKQAIEDLGAFYPDVSEADLIALTQAIYTTWEAGRTRILSIDGTTFSSEPNSDQEIYEQIFITPRDRYGDPQTISTLPGYLVEVGNFAQKGSGLLLTSGQTWLYLQANAREAAILGITLTTASFIDNAHTAIVTGFEGSESAGNIIAWDKVKLSAGNTYFGQEEFATAKQLIANAASAFTLVDKGMTFASAGADALKAGGKLVGKIAKAAKFLKSAGDVMGAASLVLDIGLAVTMFILSGDFSMKAIARLIADIVVAVMLFLLTSIPPWLGTVIAVVLAIFDLILSFCKACSEFLGIGSISGWLGENLANYFYREVPLTELQDYSFLERNHTLADEEMGFVVGNRFVITDTFQGAIKVAGSKGIEWSRVKNAAIVGGGTGAIFALFDQIDLVGRIFGGPSKKENLQNSWVCGEFTIENSLPATGSSCPDKSADYELDTIPGDANHWVYENDMHTTVPLNRAEHNFTILLSTKIQAQTRWDASTPIPPIIGGIPLGRIHWTKERTITLPDDMDNDQKKQWQITPIYVDVLPASIDDLWHWGQTDSILINHDPDGDGMSTKDEVNAYLGINSYLNLKNYFGSMLDAKNQGDLDRFLANWDYYETSGAYSVLNGYCTTYPNHAHICDTNSSPPWLVWDFDQDGLSDKFEYDKNGVLGTNAFKYDTDGDGLSDGFEYEIGTRIDKKDSDADGLSDDIEVYHPTSSGAWDGGWDIELLKYGAVGPSGRFTMTARVFSDPLSKDTDGDGLSDYAEKENGTSPMAYNRVPRVMLSAEPTAVSPQGISAVYVKPGDLVTMTSRLEVYPPYTVSSTMRLDIPYAAFGFPVTTHLNGSRWVDNTGVTHQARWDFSDNVLQPWEYLYGTTTSYVPSISQSTEVTASLRLPYGAEGQNQEDTTLFVIDVENPEFGWMTPSHGELIGGGVTHYVVGGTSGDKTTWVDELTLYMPGNTVNVTDTESFSPWAYTWELPNDGIYDLSGYSSDFVGHNANQQTVQVMVDNTAPSVDVDLQDGAVYGPPQDSEVITITLNGTATENYSGLTRVQISTDGGPWREVWTLDTATVTNTTFTDFNSNFSHRATAVTWDAVWTMPNVETVQGYHSLRVRAFDLAGNWPTYLEREIIIDVLPPTDELVNNAYLYEFPHLAANEPHTFDGVANDVGNVPDPSRPIELAGDVDGMEDATIMLGLDTIHDNDAGVYVAWIGDFNGDRRGDLVVGLPAADGGNGRVSVVYGRSGDWAIPDEQERLTNAHSSFVGTAGAGVGRHIMPAGDVNGDGQADLMIGDPANNRIFLIFGRPTYFGSDKLLEGPQGANWTILIPPDGQTIGSVLGAAGDVNGDGFADILVGATGSSNVGYLILGQANPWWPSVPVDTMAAARLEQGGAAMLTGLGDLDGDFYDEFAVGVNNNLYIFAGRGSYAPQAGSYTYLSSAVDTISSADAAPEAVALGDVNGDNIDDFIYSNGTSQVLHYGDATLDGSWSTHTYSYGSSYLAAPGDVDNDGKNDILIGNGTDAYLISSSDVGSAQAIITGVSDAATTPYAAGADLNSDGSSDLLFVPEAAGSLAAAESSADSIADLPPTWVPQLPEQSLETFTGDTTWPSESANAYVSADGVCHGLTPCYTTIQDAVNAHKNTSTIFVQPGVYAPFIIDGDAYGYNGLTVRGIDTDAVIIDGNDGSYGIRVNNATAVNLENMTVRNAGYGVQLDRAGINGHEITGNRTELRYLLIYDTGSHDVYMTRNSTVSVINSTLSRSSSHIGTYGAADPNIVVEWSSMANTTWSITDGGGAVLIDDVIYVNRGGGHTQFDRYSVDGNYWFVPWGPSQSYEADSVIAAGSDKQVYLLGAPNLRDTNRGGGFDAEYATGNGPMYATKSDNSVVYWDGTNWASVPGGANCYKLGAHPDSGELYCYDYIDDIIEKYENSSWVTVANVPFYFSSISDMAIDSNGTPHIVGSFSIDGGFETCYGYAKWSGASWSCSGDFDNDNYPSVIAIGPNDEVYVGGSFTTEYARNLTAMNGSINGVTDSVYGIDVDEVGVVYVTGNFTSTLNYDGTVDKAAPARVASWDGQWTTYPVVIDGTPWFHAYGGDIVATGGGEFYATGGWEDPFGDGGEAEFIHWNGSSWELGDAHNGSNNEAFWNLEANGQGVFFSGDITSLDFDGASESLNYDGVLQSPFEVYSTTQNSWYSGLIGPPMQLGDGASMAGDEEGNLVVLVGGGRTDSFKYVIETGQWSRVSGMNTAVNASAMTIGEDGDIYAVTDGPDTLYRFSGFSWSAVGPTLSGSTIDDGVALAYDSHFGTYYLLPGGNGTKMYRYNPDWGSSWEELPVERNTPAGVRPGAGMVFAEGEDENYLYTAQGNYIGDNSTAFWRYNLPMPNKIDFTDSIIYAQNATNWLNLSDPLPEDFNFRVDANSRFFGGSGWTPTNMGTLTTTTDVPFLDVSRDLYRMGENGTSYTIGYHTYTAPVTATTDTGIQAMINTGANQIIVEPGIYEEDVYLVNGVEIIGTNPDWTIIKPLNGSAADALVRAMGSNGASFSRFTLDGEDSGLDGFAATGNAANLTLQRARIYETETAISLDGPDSDVEIVHVTAANNNNGLAATSCASIDVRNTIFAYHSGSGLSHESCAATKLHTYNLYWANANDFGGDADAGAAELFLDPSFVDPMDHDYRTLNFSPVIDAGNPTDPAPPGAGSRADIGYIEQGRVNFYVDDSYCDICINDGLTWKVDAFDNIQEALDAAEHAVGNLNPTLSAVPQLVVGVAPGTYNEQVSIPSHVLLFGSGAEQTILDAGGSGTAVSFDGVSQSGLHHMTIMNAGTGIAVTGASNMVDIQRNIIRSNGVGVAVNGRATGELEFNTLIYNTTGVTADGPGSWLALMHNIVSGSDTGLSAGNFGQLFTDYNLFYNTLDANGMTLGSNDITGQDPLLAGGENPYRLSESSPALDAAEEQAKVPDGGGARADLGYSELLAAPVTLILGKEDLSTVMGNSGVDAVEVSIVAVPDPTSEITATLPVTWADITLDTPGETVSYWSLDYTPTEEGFYRFYSRATDAVGNQEDDQEDWYDGSFIVDNTPPAVTWLTPISGTSLSAPLELRAQVSDYAAGAFSVDENDVYFEVDGTRYPATWAAEPWDESANEPRIFRAWISPTLGSYSNVAAGAEDKAGNTAVDSNMAFDVTAVSPEDTTPPTVTVSVPLPGSFVTHTINFAGTASDTDSGIASVELSLDGGATWEPTIISGTTWSLIFDGPEELPMISYPAQVRATDRAGLQTAVSFEFTVDEVAPIGLIPVTFNHPEGSHFDTITDLEINWEPAIDASGTVSTYLTVDQITETIAADPVSGLTAVHTLNSSGDWYVHLGALDGAGNVMMTHFGPWHVGLTDGAFGSRSQSIIIDGYVDVAANEWRLDTEYLDDDERTYGSEVTYSPGGQQAFLTTWDANHYYLAWRGGHWALDGELWVYLKAGGSGSTEMIVPPASAPDATLPFAANYAIRITDPVSGTLYEYSSGWQESAQDWAFAQGSEGDTEVRLPLFGTSDVEALAFGLGDDHNVWAIFPTTNPLNPNAGVTQQDQSLMMTTSLAAMQTNGAGGWQGYQWADVTAVTDVSENQPQAVGLALSLDSVQAPQAAWAAGSTLEYIVEIFNAETEIISGQPITFTATPAAALVHDSIEGATCSTTNPWECTLDPLTPGFNTITLTTHLAADITGIDSVVMKASLTGTNLTPELITDGVTSHQVDGAPPMVAVNVAPFVNLGSQTFVGTASDGDGAGVDYVEVRPQYGNWQRVDGTEFWTADLTVSPFAQHGDIWQFEVRAADHHGQISAPKLVTFTVDLLGPAVAFHSPTQLSGGVNQITGTITDVPNSSEALEVMVQLDNEQWREAQLFNLNEETGEQPFMWTWNMPTEDGAMHTLRVSTVDLVGNSGSLSPEQQVWVDNVTPVITVTGILTEVAIQHYVPGAQSGAPVLLGNVTDGSGVSAVDVWVQKPNGENYQEAATLTDQTWQFIPGFESLGMYKMQVRAWDTLGNLAQTAFYDLEVKAAPDTGPNQFTTPEDTPIAFEPLLDDLDIDSPTIFLDGLSNPLHGQATISPTTWVVYTPTQNFNGVDIFTYVASDGQFTDTATITITVLPINDPPKISGPATITATMDEDDGSLSFSFSGINVDDETWSWHIDEGMGTAVVSRTYGTGDINADVIYTPERDFAGYDSFRVQASDGQYKDEVSVLITVNGVDDAPRAADDYVVIVPGESGTPLTLDVIDNDDEVDGQTLLLDGVQTPSNGGAAQVSGDQIVYTPTLAAGESETVTYIVSDGVLTDTAVIHTTVVEGDASGRAGETMIMPSFGVSQTMTITLTIPSDLGDGDEQVTLVLAETAVADDPPAAFKFAGLSFALHAYVDGVLTSPFTFDTPLTLAIEYSDEDVAHIGKGDDELVFLYWSGTEWLNDGITIVAHDKAQNRMVVTVAHLTDFALFGKDAVNVYLPLVIRP